MHYKALYKFICLLYICTPHKHTDDSVCSSSHTGKHNNKMHKTEFNILQRRKLQRRRRAGTPVQLPQTLTCLIAVRILSRLMFLASRSNVSSSSERMLMRLLHNSTTTTSGCANCIVYMQHTNSHIHYYISASHAYRFYHSNANHTTKTRFITVRLHVMQCTVLLWEFCLCAKCMHCDTR